MVGLLSRSAGAALGLLAATLLAASPALAGDPAHGKAVFSAQCAMCHSSQRNVSLLGPSLFGVVGRKAGSVVGFAYSPAMKAAGFNWTDDKLRAYLPAPKTVVPGTRMTYAGLKNPSQLDDLVAYLDTLK
jgi:cytochrome c